MEGVSLNATLSDLAASRQQVEGLLDGIQRHLEALGTNLRSTAAQVPSLRRRARQRRGPPPECSVGEVFVHGLRDRFGSDLGGLAGVSPAPDGLGLAPRSAIPPMTTGTSSATSRTSRPPGPGARR